MLFVIENSYVYAPCEMCGKLVHQCPEHRAEAFWNATKDEDAWLCVSCQENHLEKVF